MRKLQLGLIILTATSVGFVVGCGDNGGGTKRRGTIQNANNKRGGAANKAGVNNNNLGDGVTVTDPKKPGAGQTVTPEKFEGEVRESADAAQSTVKNIEVLRDDVAGNSKLIKISEIPDGTYQLTKIAHTVMFNSNQEAIFHSFDILPPKGDINNFVLYRTPKILDFKSNEKIWKTEMPTRFVKEKDKAMTIPEGVKYESKNEGKKLLLALSLAKNTVDLPSLQNKDLNQAKAYVLSTTSDGGYDAVKVLSSTGKIILVYETNRVLPGKSINKLRSEFYVYTLQPKADAEKEKPATVSSKDDGSKT